jgi:hypothetical protein
MPYAQAFLYSSGTDEPAATDVPMPKPLLTMA